MWWVLLFTTQTPPALKGPVWGVEKVRQARGTAGPLEAAPEVGGAGNTLVAGLATGEHTPKVVRVGQQWGGPL